MHTAAPPLLALIGLAALQGCEAPQPMVQTAPPEAAREQTPEPPAPIYLADSAPIPFLPLPDRIADASPDDALVQARLVAIFSANKAPKAMFTDARGHGHIFEIGDRFWGGGRIAGIAPNKVEIDVTPPHRPDAPPGRIVMRLFDDAAALTHTTH